MPASAKKESRYRSNKAIPVLALTSWRAPFTGGYERSLPEGEAFTVLFDSAEPATAAACMPDRYDDLHSHFIPAKDREAESYAGYYLVISLRELADSCVQLSQ